MTLKFARLAAAAALTAAAGIAFAQPSQAPINPPQTANNPSPSGPTGVGSQAPTPMNQSNMSGSGTGTGATGTTSGMASGETRTMRAPRSDRN